ncbi:MAG TPA: trehalase family glycosidase [Phycisphaerae bacterium]|nr:trehalase family glycosidase [Phycisphaerae bacterium]HNU46602.1 trehalase family glycosidase [Phycisphaerae bacterium]
MEPHTPTGWNTWDFRGFNRFVRLDTGRTQIVVLYALWDEAAGKLHDAFRWSDARRIGPHAPLGLPASLEFSAGSALFRAEAVEQHGALVLGVTPLEATALRVVFILAAPVGETPALQGPTEAIFAGHTVLLEGAHWPDRYFLNLAEPYAVGEPGAPAGLLVVPTGTPPAPVTRPVLTAAVEAYEQTTVAGSGALADAPQAMMRAIAWNTLYDPRRRLVSSPVSRDWCSDWCGPIVFGWDSFFAGTLAAAASPVLARANFEAALAGVDEVGFVPNYIMAHGATSLDRSMPCLGAYLILKTQQLHPDRTWLQRMYPRLVRWHQFWMKHRDGNGDGLLEWGSDPTPPYEFPRLLAFNPSIQHTAKCAQYEAGLDNSPMYDDVPFNTDAHTLELADVGLNSCYAMDCEALATLAAMLGHPDDAAGFRAEYEALKQRINDTLWDDARGMYANRRWDGTFLHRWSPTSFFPLLAGIPSAPQAERLVREHLLNNDEFWGPYVIPSIARNDPAFADNDYWRGRIWGPFNFLVAEGLRRYHFDDVAADLASRGLRMFLENWQADGGVYENYNATTGKGADVWNAARLYHWGGLLALTALQELVDVEPAGYLRFGSLDLPPAGVRNLYQGVDRYDVELDDGVHVRRSGVTLLECSARAIIRLPVGDPADRPVEITARTGGELSLYNIVGTAPPARLNGADVIQPRPAAHTWVYTWSR